MTDDESTQTANTALLARIDILQAAITAILETHPHKEQVLNRLLTMPTRLAEARQDQFDGALFTTYVAGAQDAVDGIVESLGY
ncbi:hypothetical protein [Rhizobium sp. CSW-27]|uniref:hypothetical protein n=1 Tax=Rhizobium sp. CSW-27 TaxID=2839985 RepID=UPI001C025F4B|nr:hypothetical protein [Rhizobium sp. CSW-27]MBT9370299.1 hypothetical protein [Rhizobium sp. CSW-27]